MELSRRQPTPLYYQLKTLLIEEILSGAYGTDGRLPTEHELCRQFGMSRTPVTRAVSELAAEGVVLRRRRHGTFVNPHWLARRADSAEVRVMVPDDAGWAEHLRSVAPPGMRLSIAETDVSDLHSIFIRAVAEGHAADLAVLDSVWLAEFAASGFLWPLEDLDATWINGDYGRDFLQPFVDAHRFGGSTLAVQVEMDVGGLWYRRADLASVGADCPRTWAELLETGRRLSTAGTRQYPLVLPAGPAADEFTTYCLVTLLASNGAQVLSPDAVTLNSPASTEAMELLRSLADDKIVPAAAVGFDRDRPIQNFESLGNYSGDHGIGFGPKMNVPGLGTVDIPATIDQQAEQVGPGTQMKQLVWDWARLVNQQMPYLTYATKVYQFPHSSQRFTNWPPMDAQGTSPLWNILGQGNMTQGLTLMLEQGYIQPKS